MSTEKHGFPAFLSAVVPGLGQLIKGHVAKGILILLSPLGALLIMAIVTSAKWQAGGFILLALAICALIGWIWQISDAYNSNSK